VPWAAGVKGSWAVRSLRRGSAGSGARVDHRRGLPGRAGRRLPLSSELLKESPREGRVFLVVSGKARESQSLGAERALQDPTLGDLKLGQTASRTPAAVRGFFHELSGPPRRRGGFAAGRNRTSNASLPLGGSGWKVANWFAGSFRRPFRVLEDGVEVGRFLLGRVAVDSYRLRLPWIDREFRHL
jgi:hypothetical protein